MRRIMIKSLDLRGACPFKPLLRHHRVNGRPDHHGVFRVDEATGVNIAARRAEEVVNRVVHPALCGMQKGVPLPRNVLNAEQSLLENVDDLRPVLRHKLV